MAAAAEVPAAACVASVEVVAGRYPFKPVCSCGWSYWGYVARHAAEGVAEAHQKGELR